MEGKLYIRFRGRVLGPYDREQLQALSRRGQLSRMHELSADAVAWQRASEYPELFVSTALAPASVVEPQSKTRALPEAESQDEGDFRLQQPAHDGGAWYYMQGQERKGPLSLKRLQKLCWSNEVEGETMVWTEGMAAWAAAGAIPSLFPNARQTMAGAIHVNTDASALGQGHQGELGEGLCRSAIGSRPWVLFIAVTTFVYAALIVIFGVMALVGAGKERIPGATAPVIALGLFQMIYGVVVAAGGVLLTTYASRLSGLAHARNPVVLEKALDALRTFWIFTSMILVVWTAFIVVAVVWIISIAGSL